MYNGNITDFVNKITEYMYDTYGLYIHTGDWPQFPGVRSNCGFIMLSKSPIRSGGVVTVLYDENDLEENVYKYINKELKVLGYV